MIVNSLEKLTLDQLISRLKMVVDMVSPDQGDIHADERIYEGLSGVLRKLDRLVKDARVANEPFPLPHEDDQAGDSQWGRGDD